MNYRPWMSALALALMAATPALAADLAAPPAIVPKPPEVHEQPAWFKNSFLDLREDVAEATAAGKRVLLYFYQDGCPYCAKLLRDNLGQKAIADRTRAHFDVLALNLWGDREVTDPAGRIHTEKSYAKALRVQFTPTIMILDERGDVALRLNGYLPPHEFVAALTYAAERRERTQSFAEYLRDHAGPPASARMHAEPGFLPAPLRLADALAQGGGKPLVALFEQGQCAACDELHADALPRPEVRALLARLLVAQIDVTSREAVQTPSGQTLPAREWARALGVAYTPSLVFFDGGGREVFRVEGYLRPFHFASSLDYVASGAYLREPEFQRYVEARASARRARGERVDLMR